MSCCRAERSGGRAGGTGGPSEPTNLPNLRLSGGALAALTDVMDQPLLTPASVALSLSPPRTPPYDSPVRKLYNDPTAARRHLAGILQAARDDLNGGGDASTSDGGGGYQSHAIASR
ncbi:hypothetical protein THAOC_22729, partial [Thalassiosira oceanica]